MIGGRVAIRLCPDVLARLAVGRTSMVITGTNGKTTTSHLVAAAISGRGPVAHNAAGSNMPDGAVTALMEAAKARLCVLEVDELHLGPVVAAVGPDVVVLLNLSRDQLDRVSEIRSTARKVAAVLAGHPETMVVANADDPMVVWAVGAAARVVWVAAGGAWQADTLACPRCGQPLSRQPDGERSVSWSCRHCGLRRPDPQWRWEADQPDPYHKKPRDPQQQREEDRLHRQSSERARQERASYVPVGDSRSSPEQIDVRGVWGFVVHHRGGAPVRVWLGLPGRVNAGNATMALAAAAALGTDPAAAAARVAAVRGVAGRYGRLAYRNRRVRSVLVKNPAGWGEALDMLTADGPVLLVINAREADGRDVSWLWDVPVEALRGRAVAVAGERAADLGVRLSYAEVPHITHRDPLAALEALPAGEIDAVANYTAFRDLQQALSRPDRARPAHPAGPGATTSRSSAVTAWPHPSGARARSGDRGAH